MKRHMKNKSILRSDSDNEVMDYKRNGTTNNKAMHSKSSNKRHSKGNKRIVLDGNYRGESKSITGRKGREERRERRGKKRGNCIGEENGPLKSLGTDKKRHKLCINHFYTEEDVAQALLKAKGLQSYAGKLLGVTSARVSQYVKQWPNLRKTIEQADEDMKDFAQDTLYELIRDKNIPATIFYLKTKVQNRGFIERPQFQGDFTVRIQYDESGRRLKQS